MTSGRGWPPWMKKGKTNLNELNDTKSEHVVQPAHQNNFHPRSERPIAAALPHVCQAVLLLRRAREQRHTWHRLVTGAPQARPEPTPVLALSPTTFPEFGSVATESYGV